MPSARFALFVLPCFLVPLVACGDGGGSPDLPAADGAVADRGAPTEGGSEAATPDDASDASDANADSADAGDAGDATSDAGVDTDADADAGTEDVAADADAGTEDVAVDADAGTEDVAVDAADAEPTDAKIDAEPIEAGPACPTADQRLDVQPIAAGSPCANGGRRSRSGIDTNQNCVLDDAEVLSIAFLCEPPSSPATSSVRMDVTNEPAGAACAHGGQSVRSGVDRNSDGSLSSDEIENTPYVCNGLGAGVLVQVMEPRAADAKCEAGGLRIRSGLDASGNGALDAAEERDAVDVCFTSPGRSPGLVSLLDEPSTALCPAGGKRFATGRDLDGDGRLQSSEVTASNGWCRPGSAPATLVSRLYVRTEPPEGLCEGTGRSIVSGNDSNASGALDDSERLRLAPLCDPVDAKWRSLSGRLDGLPLSAVAQGMASAPWAAGRGGVLRFDGQAFQPAPGLAPLALRAQDKVRVAPLSDSDVWIFVPGGAYLQHWEGTTWTLVPTALADFQDLTTVKGSNGAPTLIAAATQGGCGGTSGYLFQWTELGWSQITGATSCFDYPLVVAGTSGNDLWAARWGYASPGSSDLVTHLDHWDGQVWSRPPQPLNASEIDAIHILDSNAAWAVGHDGVALQWNGTQWLDVPTNLSSTLRAIASTPSNEVWIGGVGGRILRRAGTSWQDVSLPVQEEVSGLWAQSNSVLWATTIESGSIYRWNGLAWSLASGPFDTRDLRGAWAPSPGALWAVGNKGLVVNVTQGARSRVDVGTQSDLRDVWGTSANDMWVVGANGTMLHFDGQWTRVPTPETGTLTRIWGTSADNLWAIGDAGILRWDPSTKTWSLVYAETGLRGIGGTDSQAWFVGDFTLLVFENGAFRQVQTPRPDPAFFAIWFGGLGDAWIASDREELFRFDGVNAPARIANGPYGRLWGPASNQVYASGNVWGGDVVRRWDGATWSDVMGLDGIAAITGRGSRDLWAVGTHGMILRYE